MEFCNNCGAPLNGDAAFCTTCGSKITSTAQPATNTMPMATQNDMPIATQNNMPMPTQNNMPMATQNNMPAPKQPAAPSPFITKLKKIWQPLLIGIGIAFLIFSILLYFINTNSKPDVSTAKKGVIDDYFKALLNSDYDSYKKLFPTDKASDLDLSLQHSFNSPQELMSNELLTLAYECSFWSEDIASVKYSVDSSVKCPEDELKYSYKFNSYTDLYKKINGLYRIYVTTTFSSSSNATKESTQLCFYVLSTSEGDFILDKEEVSSVLN